MTYYLSQFRYKDSAFKAMVENPQDREAAASHLMEAFGGKLHQFFFAFGDYDGVAISEFPDEESATACLMTIAASGAFEELKTTVLISSEEGKRAMSKAQSLRGAYTPPKS